MVDLLLERYGWTDDYVESLDFERFDKKLKLIAKSRRQRQENEERNRQAELLITARSIFFGLQANSDLPPSKADSKRKKPDWPRIEKARRAMMNMMDNYQKALGNPYDFAKYMGLPPIWDKPEGEIAPARLKTRKDVESMKERMISNLTRIRDQYGPDADLRTIGQAAQVEEVEPEDGLEVASEADVRREIRR